MESHKVIIINSLRINRHSATAAEVHKSYLAALDWLWQSTIASTAPRAQ